MQLMPEDKSKIHFYFHHGWGFTSSCFEKWMAFTAFSKCTMLNRGYLGNTRKLISLVKNEFNVLVCHSLGLHFFHQEQLKSFDMLILLSSFACFHSLDETNVSITRKHIKRMSKRLASEPVELLTDFYRDCFWAAELPDFAKMNIQLLADDLHLLDTAQLRNFDELSKKKILIIHGSKDRIVSKQRSLELKKNLPESSLVTIDGAGHGLPFTHTNDCINCVEEFFHK